MKVGILLSGGGTNAQALIDACASGDVPADIAVVISNRRKAGGLDRARAAGIPAVHIGHRQFDTREQFDQALTDCLREHSVDWVACAGFMRLLTPVFLDAWTGRVLNIHPALLPAFPGVDGQAQAHAYGVRIAGCTVHFVDAGTDTGAIIAQGAVPVLPTDDRDALQERILAVEHRLYPMVLKMAVEGRLRQDGRHVQVDLRDREALLLM
ncbi:MAG: phosphoribosylglycinamide formyltransferase [Proteobacteria bacterium]|nr:phosphoribosylglycinamide formyltransferase [Pseudomonadota bacterium]MCP4917976.1 phosphoribosylglycinamide formyltransferase [Pseudomonadota bacterium]